MKFALVALLALASTQALADARSIETAECTIKINGSETAPQSFSLENLNSPKILAEGGGFVLQAAPLFPNAVLNNHYEDTVNPIGLEIVTADNIILGAHSYNGGEGTTSINTMMPLSNGELVSIQASCTVSYVE